MQPITINLPDDAFSSLRLSPTEFARELRVAAAVHWYAQQRISQEKAASIADMSRAEFLAELFRQRIPAVQVTIDELRREIDG